MATPDQRFIDQLRRQLDFLERSSVIYDSGKQDEAIRLATTIRVIIHTTPHSTSLLSHLGGEQIHLLSTCMDLRPMLDGSDPFYAGTRFQFFNGMALLNPYRAKLGDGPFRRLLLVPGWWNETVYVLDHNTSLTRRNIVLDAANTDGGAHVAARLRHRYAALVQPGSLGEIVSQQNGQTVGRPIADGHFVALRQMAYEILNSQELLNLAS